MRGWPSKTWMNCRRQVFTCWWRQQFPSPSCTVSTNSEKREVGHPHTSNTWSTELRIAFKLNLNGLQKEIWKFQTWKWKNMTFRILEQVKSWNRHMMQWSQNKKLPRGACQNRGRWRGKQPRYRIYRRRERWWGTLIHLKRSEDWQWHRQHRVQQRSPLWQKKD